MPYHKWTVPEAEAATALRDVGLTYAMIADKLSARFGTERTEAKVSDAFRKGVIHRLTEGEAVEPQDRERKEWGEDGSTLVTSNRAFSDEEMAEMFDVDVDLWRVTKRVTNVWGGNTQTKLWWEPVELNHLAREWDELLRQAEEEGASRKHPEPFPTQYDTFYEIALFDAHLGSLAWAPEAGKDYDLSIGVERYREAFMYLLNRAPRGTRYLLWCVGQDLFHFDTLIKGKGGATALGTPQDVDSRWMKLFAVVAKLHVDLITEARGRGLEVKVVVQPGNHDTQTTHYLGAYLEAWFRQDFWAIIDNSPAPRKYHRDGEVQIGFTHGHREKSKDLYRLMTRETKAVTDIMEWHVGHLHYEQVDGDGGVTLRRMKTMSLPDAWHTEQGYESGQGAHGFLWHPEVGLLDQYYWVDALMSPA